MIIMKRSVLSLLMVLVLLTSGLAARAEETKTAEFHATISGLKERGGVLIEELPPGLSKAETEERGVVYDKKPLMESENTETGRTSVIYGVENAYVTVTVDGVVSPSVMCQFGNDQLANITLYLPDMESVQAVYDALALEFGEPQEMGRDFDKVSMKVYFWEYDAAGRYGRAALSYQYEDGACRNVSLDFAWLPPDWFPNLYEKVDPNRASEG